MNTGRSRRVILVALTAALLGTIVSTSPESRVLMPPRVDTSAAGEFVWHDLVTHDPAASRAFYAALFGWTFEEADGIDPGYTIITHGGRPIGGIVLLQPRNGEEIVAQWLSYVAVSDVDRVTKVFQQAGGRVFRGPLNARKDLRVAVVADAQGAPLGLASRGPRLEAETPPGLHHWLWREYVARDPAAALTFYREALGFEHEVHETRENFTYYLLATDQPRAGLFLSPWKHERSVWLPYVRVADPDASAARAVELGGTILLQPRPEVRGGSLAIVLDPTGAPLALQKYPFDGGRQ